MYRLYEREREERSQSKTLKHEAVFFSEFATRQSTELPTCTETF